MDKSLMRTKLIDRAAGAAVFLLACISVAAVVLICAFLLINGIPAMKETGVSAFLFGKIWRPSNNEFGILPMLAGSLLVTLCALAAAVPAGVLTAVFLTGLCSAGSYRIIKAVVEVMAGIPSVVYGFFGLSAVVPLVRKYAGGRGVSLLSASLVLGMMILPTIITASETALRAVPADCRQAAAALGASDEYSLIFAVLPAARRGIISGVVLGLGRAMGETMAVVMVAGNQPLVPQRLTDGVRTLTANIALEMGYAADLHRSALVASAVVLFVLVLMVNLLFSLVGKEKNR